MARGLILVSLLFLSALLYSQAFKVDRVKEDSSLYSSDVKFVRDVRIIGNRITKAHIITRELSFKMHDSIPSDQFLEVLEQSRKNILNTSLFNFVRIDWALENDEDVYLIIHLQERWYLFPAPIFEIDDNNFNTWWQEKDFSRLNYGFHVIRNNFRGRKEKLILTAQYGFTERYRLRYEIPYINQKQKLGLRFNFSYNRRDQINYSSFDNERLQYKSQENDALRNLSGSVALSYRNAIFNTHFLGLEFDQNRVRDSVRLLNPNYLGDSRERLNYFSLYYTFTRDLRDSRNYPLKGSYLNFQVKKYGLGIMDESVDLTNLQLQYKKFWQLEDRWFFASSFRGVLASNDNQPYLLQNGLGYNSFSIRAYEYYVIDGQNIGLFKAQLRYQLVKPNHATLNFIPMDRFNKFHYAFYLGIFSDAAYVDDRTGFPMNSLANEMQFGYGIGLDFVTYYDVVIRTEYSFNKLGESGIFLHFVAPI
jgi:outer membrane protein assembly factor BamA